MMQCKLLFKQLNFIKKFGIFIKSKVTKDGNVKSSTHNK